MSYRPVEIIPQVGAALPAFTMGGALAERRIVLREVARTVLLHRSGSHRLYCDDSIVPRVHKPASAHDLLFRAASSALKGLADSSEGVNGRLSGRVPGVLRGRYKAMQPQLMVWPTGAAGSRGNLIG